MTDNVPAEACSLLAWCRAHRSGDSAVREHLGELLDLSDRGHRLTLVCWQGERDGVLLDQPRIRITYGPIHPLLRPAWLDLGLGEADRFAEILSQLTMQTANDLINGLYGGCLYGDIGSASGPVDARSW